MNRWGVNTQPWGPPVLSTNVEKVTLPIQTPCLFVRKSNIRLHRVHQNVTFSNQLHGQTVLNAELKLTYFSSLAVLTHQVSEE